MKTKVSISIDPFIYEDAKNNHINISQTTQEALQTKLAILKDDINGINIGILKNKLDKWRKKSIEAQKKVSNYQNKLDQIDKIQKDKEAKELENQKKQLENQNKCIVCKTIIDNDKFTKVNSGNIMCNNCFLNGNDPTKW